MLSQSIHNSRQQTQPTLRRMCILRLSDGSQGLLLLRYGDSPRDHFSARGVRRAAVSFQQRAPLPAPASPSATGVVPDVDTVVIMPGHLVAPPHTSARAPRRRRGDIDIASFHANTASCISGAAGCHATCDIAHGQRHGITSLRCVARDYDTTPASSSPFPPTTTPTQGSPGPSSPAPQSSPSPQRHDVIPW